MNYAIVLQFTDNGIVSFKPFADSIADEDFPSALPALIAPYFDDHASNGNMLFYRQSTASPDLEASMFLFLSNFDFNF